MHDLVVVGAGPVGSFLAWKFAEKGRDVLLLERGEIGEPLRCTGHISKEVFDFVPRNEKIIENEIKGAIFHNDCSSYFFGGDQVRSYVIDRRKFDRFMGDKAESSGVEIRNESFQNLRRGDNSVLVQTNEGSYETKTLAGCDGPLSDVRGAANLPDPGKFLHGILTRIEPKSPEQASESRVEIYLDACDDFFGWKVPHGDEVEYGLATSPENNAREKLEEFSEEKNFTIGGIYSGLIPIQPPDKTATERIFLCGDSAAQVKPFTGGGIIYGLTSARIASEKVDPDKPRTVEGYERKWRKELGTEIWLGNQIRKFYSLPSRIRGPLLSIGTRISGGAHMDRPSTLLGCR